ncbi:MAG TPA: hypothetical protein DCY86_14290 [Bdellovibrionales bacterium]|nr:hypothetical protein [Bdellovibrionales bacterium]
MPNSKKIGVWSHGTPEPSLIQNLPHWAESHGVDTVIWTALSPKFNGDTEEPPTCEQVLKYLSRPDRSSAG